MSASDTPRFLGGYGPAVAMGIALVLVTAFIPSVSRTETVDSLATSLTDARVKGTTDERIDGADPAAGDAAVGPSGTDVVAGGADTSVAPAGSAAPTSGGGTASPGGASAAGGGAARPAAGAPAPGTTGSCGPLQVRGDAYSPPCYKWGGGDNGGATARGVTADSIMVSIREGTFDKGVIDAISQAAMRQGGSNFLAGETPELIKSTINGLVDYFNTRYEFFGRKIKIAYVKPKGDIINEVLGGGQEGADADAITVADNVKAFADLSAVSPPYADALARRKVIAIGAPYMSRQWMEDRRPYQWSWFTDCNTVAKMSTSYYLARFSGRPASLAGPAINGKARKLAVIAPDNSWFADCINGAMGTLRGSGAGQEASLAPFTYRLDLNAMAPQAYSIVPQLVSNQVTTVACFCDPLMLLFLTSKAREQGFQPEWIQTGVAFTDQDAVAQLFDQQSWNGAVGISFAGGSVAMTGGPGYRALKSVHPDAVVSKTVEALYYQIQMLAIGIQMAGPVLTPQTFEQGMFKYPPHSGPAGTWTFGPGDYTAAGDAREIFYSASKPSTAAGGSGSWVDPAGGAKRYNAGEFPRADPVNR